MTSILKGSKAVKNVSREKTSPPKSLIKSETILRSTLSRFFGRGENRGWNRALLDLVSQINDDDYGFFHITTNWAFQGSIPPPALQMNLREAVGPRPIAGKQNLEHKILSATNLNFRAKNQPKLAPGPGKLNHTKNLLPSFPAYLITSRRYHRRSSFCDLNDNQKHALEHFSGSAAHYVPPIYLLEMLMLWVFVLSRCLIDAWR